MFLNIGQQVRVQPRHWLRPNATGIVIAFDEESARWLIEFVNSWSGGGIDGNKLYLHENDIVPVAKIKRRRTK